MRRAFIGGVAVGLVAVAFSAAVIRATESTEEELKNPYLGKEALIEEGKRIYRSKCIGCHRQTGGRALNLFKTKLTDEQFLEVVLNGRYGTRGQMPAFGYRMSPDDVWKVHAFVKSRDSY